MNNKQLIKPKVFISYSWSSEDHVEWVRALAERLMSDGVDVILDKWALKSGHDKFVFMEQMSTSEDIDNVLIICDTMYREKANARAGGVGQESQILTPEIYNKIDQEKFIPVIAEDAADVIPVFLKSIMYRNLSSLDTYEENYKLLLRDIYKVPLSQKPALGSPPAFLSDQNVSTYNLKENLRKIDSAIYKNPQIIRSLMTSFNENFFQGLDELLLSYSDFKDSDTDIVLTRIDETLPFRDLFVELIKKTNSSNLLDSDYIVDFFEKLFDYYDKRIKTEGTGTIHAFQSDHYRFLIHELFLHLVMTLLDQNSYDLLSEILHSDYYLNTYTRKNEECNFVTFRIHLESFDLINQRNKMNLISLQAKYLYERTTGKDKSKLIEADLFLYNVSKITLEQDGTYFQNVWYPITSIYEQLAGERYKLYAKLKQKSHFEKLKVIFRVQSALELQQKLRWLESNRDRGARYGHIPIMTNSIEIGLIATK